MVWGGHRHRYGGLTTAFEVVDADGDVVSRHIERDNSLVLSEVAPHATGIRAHLRDGFLHYVLTVSASLTRAS